MNDCPKPNKYQAPEADNLKGVARKDTAVLQKEGNLDDVHAKVIAEDSTEETLRNALAKGDVTMRSCRQLGPIPLKT